MAKKTVKQGTKVSPAIPTDGTVELANLNEGDYFISGGSLYILIDSDPVGMDVVTGKRREFAYEANVTPVNVEISWTKK